MKYITKTVLQRPIAAIVCIAALIIFGISSVRGLDLALIPDMNMPMMVVYTIYPNAGPEDVERLVTKEIEDGCGSISGLDSIQSSSSEGSSMVLFSFDYGVDMDDVYIDMQEAMDRVKPSLPDDAMDPIIITMDINATSSMVLSVESDKDVDVLGYVEDTVETELDKIKEVADHSVSGGREEYISIELYSEYMKQYGLNMSGVASAITSVNFTMPAGTVDYGSQSLNLSTTVKFETPEALKNVPVTTSTGQTVHLSDIANVHYSSKAADSYSRYNGNDNISIGISKNQSSSEVALSKSVTKLVDELNALNPDIHIKIIADNSETITDSINSVTQTLILGVILSMAVLFLFFGDLKGSLIVGCSMPVSLLVTFILMSFMGFNLNMVTMGALVIGIGMMVDNAIVVIEMCFRKKDEGLSFKDAAYEGTSLVIISVTASTITTAVVYLPLAMMEGLSGQMFGQLGYTIIFSITASLFSSITLVPLCFSRYMPVEKKTSPVTKILAFISDKYSRLLSKALHKKKLVALIAVIIFGISIYMVQFINMELMPSTDESQVRVSVDFRPGLRLEYMDKTVREIEEYVAASPYIEDYNATVSETSSSGSVSAYLKDDSELSTAQVVDLFGKDLAGFATNCEISVRSASSMGFSSGGGNSYQIVLKGNDLEELKEASRQVAEAVKRGKGVISVNSSLSGTGSKAELIVDPLKASAKGFSSQQIAGEVYSALSGKDALDVTVDSKEYAVTVEYPKGEYQTVQDVLGLSLTSAKGVNIPLSEMAEIVFTDTPQSIDRADGQYHATITANIEEAAKFTIGPEAQKIISGMRLPEGVTQGTNSMDEMMMEEFSAIGVAIASAVFLVFMVMAIQFESIRYSGLVMFCIPFSLIGSFFLLLITQSTFSMTSMMGFLMLVGIVVNNGILYVDTTNQFRRSGMRTEDALIATGKSRLRPILMTTLTTILSMLPLALGIGKNAEMMQGMAVVIIGGLTASTVLTLVLLPTFYMIIHKHSKEKKRRKKELAENPELKKQKRRLFKKNNAGKIE